MESTRRVRLRRIRRIGNSGGVILPADWRKQHGLDIGKEIEVVEFEEGLLLKAPAKLPSFRGRQNE